MCLLYHRCDTIGLDGKPVPLNSPRGSFTHAQKLRASMTYAFGRIYGIGSQAWQRSTNANGTVSKIGNPSISEEVSRYLLSLRRRKVSVLTRYSQCPVCSALYLGTNWRDGYKRTRNHFGNLLCSLFVMVLIFSRI